MDSVVDMNREICAILGLDANRVTYVKIEIVPGSLPLMTVEMVETDEPIRKIMSEYMLVPKESTNGGH